MSLAVRIGQKVLNWALALALLGVVVELCGGLGRVSDENAARAALSFACGLQVLVVVSWILLDGRLMRWAVRKCRMCSGAIKGCLAWFRQIANVERLILGSAITVFGLGVFVHFTELFFNCTGRWVLICFGIKQPVWGWIHWLVHWALILAWGEFCRRYLGYFVSILIPRPVIEEAIPDDVLERIDAPLGEHNMDRLHRETYIDTLLEVLEVTPRETGAQYWGIYGEWGDGKSSVFGLMRGRACGRDMVFATYDAWKLTRNGDLSMALFSIVAEALKDKSRKESRYFRDFGMALSLAGKRSILEGIPFVGEPIGRLLRGALDVSEVKKRLIGDLRQSTLRIVVAIDDLDRLAPDEVYRLLRMIKANGDLPGLIYLVMADKNYVSRCLDQVIGAKDGDMSGKRYLEKIIAQEFPLPFVQPSEFYVKFIGDLGRLREEYPEFKSFSSVNSGLKVVFHYLQNLRSEKRLINGIRVELAFHKQKAVRNAQKFPSVCFEDLVELVAIKLFREDVYYSLFENRGKIWQTAERVREDGGFDYLTEDFVCTTLLCGAQGEELSVLKNFLKDRMGVYFGSSVYRYRKPSATDLCNCRLTHLELFEGYFCSYDRRISAAVTKEFLGSISEILPDVQKTVGIFLEANKKEKLADLLATLCVSDIVRGGAADSCRALLVALAEISRSQFFSEKKRSYGYRVRPYVGDGIYVDILRAFKSVATVCMPKENERTEFILALLKKNDHFTLPALLYMDEIRARDGREPHFFSEVGLGMLRQHVIDCGRMFGNRLVDYPGEIIVRRAWLDAVVKSDEPDGERSFCKMMSAAMNGYPDAVRALWPFLTTGEEKWLVSIDYERVMKYADPYVAEDTLSREKERNFAKMLTHEVCLLEALRYCRESRKNGHVCGQIDQCNHLRFLAIEVPTSDLGRKLALRKGELV